METRKFFRITKKSYVAGVAEGIGYYWSVDSTWIRLAFVVGGIIKFWAFAAIYITLWAVLPEKYSSEELCAAEEVPEDSETETQIQHTLMKKKNNQTTGIILIVLGCIFLADSYIPGFDMQKLWPLILIAIGGVILTRDRNKNNLPSNPNSNE